ncbi:MAG: hypothetical protein K9L62_01975 [Vallitaleaceae bacterium]|nr:hypothetical protein [Vallitaleaceae bacterium]
MRNVTKNKLVMGIGTAISVGAIYGITKFVKRKNSFSNKLVIEFQSYTKENEEA